MVCGSPAPVTRDCVIAGMGRVVVVVVAVAEALLAVMGGGGGRSGSDDGDASGQRWRLAKVNKF